MGSWRDLPFDVLEVIAKKLRHNDLRNFGAVCQSWRSLYLENLSRLPNDLPLDLCHPRPFGTPLLLLSGKPDSDSREYISLVDHGDDTLKRSLFVPEAANKWICGSNWGWLVLVSIQGIEVCLYNPLTRSQIQLPSLDTFPELGIWIDGKPDSTSREGFEFICRAIISSDPTSNFNDCVVMAIVGKIHQLCFCKLEDKRWTKCIGSPEIIQDVVHYDDKFYAITQGGTMVSYGGRGKDPNSESQAIAVGPDLIGTPLRYLVVNSQGNLLQVLRHKHSSYRIVDDDIVDDNDDDKIYDWVKHETFEFEIFKLVDRNTPQLLRYGSVSDDFQGSRECNYTWAKQDGLNEESLFLGFNNTLSVPARLLPNCKGNQIYFTDDHYIIHVILLTSKIPVRAYHDIGIFDLDDKSVISYHPNDPSDLMPAVWITPNPWC